MLNKSEIEYFDGFFEWRKSSGRFYDHEELKNLSFLILFGFFRKKNDTEDTCRRRHCVRRGGYNSNKLETCDYYCSSRCDKHIISKYYDDSPSLMKDALSQKEHSLNNYKYYNNILSIIAGKSKELALILGPYRIELFHEEMKARARKSVNKHLIRNPDDTIEKYFEVKEEETKYYDYKYIEQNDFWTIYKETQIEGDLLCSLLSDF